MLTHVAVRMETRVKMSVWSTEEDKEKGLELGVNYPS